MVPEPMPPAAETPLSWRYPRRALNTLLNRHYRRRGRLHVNVLIGTACIFATSLALISIVDFAYLPGQLGGGVLTDYFLHRLYASNITLAALITAAVYAVLHFGVVRPVDYYRSHVRSLSHLKGAEQSEAMAALSYDRDRRFEQLDAALTDNEMLRQQLGDLAASQGLASRFFRSTIEAMSDRLMLVGDNGRVTELSPFAAEFLGLHRERVVGRDFDDVVRLFDAAGENPQQHRLLGLVREVMEAASPAPRLVETFFAPMHGEAVRTLVSIAAVTEGPGPASGALVRFEPYSVHDSQAQRANQKLLTTDYVTGLPGRDQLDARLRQLLGDRDSAEAAHALIFLAIDNLSATTDGLGYRAAEELMFSVEEILREHIGINGSCYRAGAEAVAALLPWTGTPKALELARRVQAAVGSRVFSAGEMRFESSISVGIAEVSREAGGPGAALEHAHTALAKARYEGGGACHVYAAGDHAPERRRSDREWSEWLQKRLDGGYLRLASQEIVALSGGGKALPMFEVFVRIEDDDGVWVTPGAFLGAAERHQLTARLDLEVLAGVLEQLRDKPELLERYACACINLSAASFATEGFAAEVLQTVSMSGVPGHRICFEIDEAHAISHKAALRRFVETMRPASIRFSLDRYRAIGGLYELRGFPLDFVKLHDSLLQCLDPGLKDEIALKHLHWASDVAGAMKIATVATGIENEAMLEPLRSIGVRFAQGLALNKLGPLLVA